MPMEDVFTNKLGLQGCKNLNNKKEILSFKVF